MRPLADLLADPVCALDDDSIAAVVAKEFGFHGVVRAHFDSERDQTAVLVDEHGDERVVKVSHPAATVEEVDLEGRAAVWAQQVDPVLPVAVPLPTRTGDRYARTPRLIRLYQRLPGQASRDGATLSLSAVKNYGTAVARLGRALRGFFHPAAQRRSLWHIEARSQIAAMTGAIAEPVGRGLVTAALDRFERTAAHRWPELRAQAVHADLTLDNLLLDSADSICGIIDFGDLTHTALIADIAAALASVGATRTGADLLSAFAVFLDGYTAVCPLEPVERLVLADTLAVRAAITVTLSANRRDSDADYLHSWDAGAWSLLGELAATDPDDLAAAFGVPRTSASTAQLLARRQAVFGSVLAPLTYGQPLTPVRGSGVTLVDSDGRTYIDAYNNVPVVGHAHPRVAAAVADQTRLLSTNLRYLHPRAIELAERLVSTMPANSGLDTVLFLNSGSEATDLAWRIATAVTGRTGAVVTDFAYHGVTTATAALSPEQWRGDWAPDHVERFSVPRGPDTRGITEAIGRLVTRGHHPAAVFVDPTYTSDGILVPGSRYHRQLSTVAHRSGALLVADEVQAGFGRSGDHLWSFIGAGLQPDLVTLGKPMGNGHPVAAVICRRADVEELSAQTEFFSTYAGGPVAAAAASTVLDVIADERLVEHTAAMGELLSDQLSGSGHWAIREVRGRGLLVGVELDGIDTSVVLDEARRAGVLIGCTGPRSDVLKIRPPLVITPDQIKRVATVVLAAIERAGGEDHRRNK